MIAWWRATPGIAQVERIIGPKGHGFTVVARLCSIAGRSGRVFPG
jgi:hypothetical protein